MPDGALNALNAAVGLVTVQTTGSEVTHGSCFLFSSHWFVITCAHVLTNMVSVRVSFRNHNLVEAVAEVVATDLDADLAVLKISELQNDVHNIRYLKLSSLDDMRIGAKVFCAGYFNDAFQLSSGDLGLATGMSLSCSSLTDHGTSGGPCVGTMFYNVYGIIKENYGESHPRTLLIHPITVFSFIKKLISQHPPLCPHIELFGFS